MKLLYVHAKNVYPQDKHLLDGLGSLGHEVHNVTEEKSAGWTHIKNQLRGTKDARAVIIGFTLPLYAIKTGLFTRKPVVFNAALTQYEANVISRGNENIFGCIKWWIIDFLSFHLSSQILLESRAQIDFVHKKFFVPKRKLILSYSGLDEDVFFYDEKITKAEQFTVLFRGRFLPESGIDTVIRAAKKLEGSDIRFLVIGSGFLYREIDSLIAELKPKNLEHIKEILSDSELRKKMLSAHISLGQLADHPRLDRTLPCKLFESLALRLPYLTARNKGVLELLEEDITCIASNPGDPDDLVSKILYLKENPDIRERIAAAGYNLYKEKLTSKILTEKVLRDLF